MDFEVIECHMEGMVAGRVSKLKEVVDMEFGLIHMGLMIQ